jgi:hypothetical protein
VTFRLSVRIFAHKGGEHIFLIERVSTTEAAGCDGSA